MTAGRRNDGDTPAARIAIGGFQHQTNTFAPSLATQRECEMGDEWPELTTGAGLPERVRGMNLPIVGFIDEAERSGHRLLPTTWGSASPSSYVIKHAYEHIAGLIVEGLRAARPHDAVYLCLHGAMVTEHFEDGEGELLRRYRRNHVNRRVVLPIRPAGAGDDADARERDRPRVHARDRRGRSRDGAAATGLAVWLGYSCRISDDGETLYLYDGDEPVNGSTAGWRDDPRRFRDALRAALAGPIAAGGPMHSDMSATGPAVVALKRDWDGPIVAYPNSRHALHRDWRHDDFTEPEAFSRAAEGWMRAGAQVVGGCCGIGPEHVAALHRRLAPRGNPQGGTR